MTILWLILYAAIVVFFIIPYFRFNHILQWDSVGHYLNAWTEKKFLWPFPGGWNPFFFTGYPQGIFYPPIFHYVVAGLSFLVSLQTAFHLVVGSAILLTPLSFYLYAKSLKFSLVQSTVLMYVLTAVLIIPVSYSSANNAIGGTLYSTFDIGLVVNALALPLFVIYIASLHIHLSRKKYLWPSVILALVFLTHTYTALAAIVYSVIYILTCSHRREYWASSAKHIGLSLLLTAWWWVPFLIYRQYSATIEIDLVLGSGSFLFLVIGMGVLIWLAMKNRINELHVPVIFFLTLTFGLLLLNIVPWPIHAYRLILFPMLMVPVFFVRLCGKKYLLNIVLGLATLCIIWGITSIGKYPGIDVRGPHADQLTPIERQLSNRVLVLSGSDEQESPHINEFTLPLRTGNLMSKGLFVESSRTARYLLALEKMMDITSWVWGIPVPDEGLQPIEEKNSIIIRRLQQLGISTVLSAKTLNVAGLNDVGEAMRYYVPADEMQATLQGVVYTIPIVDSRLYFYQIDHHLLLVNRQSKKTTVSIFATDALPTKAILTLAGTSYYVHQLYDDIWNVDMTTPNNIVFSTTENVLAPLQQFAEQQKDGIATDLQRLIVQLHSQLETTNDTQIRQQYSASQHIDLHEAGSVTQRNEQIKTIHQPRTFIFHAYTLRSNTLVAPLPQSPEKVGAAWQTNVDQWFFSDTSDKVLINTSSQLAPFHQAKIRNVQVNEQQTRLLFTIDGNQPSPVYIAISYFPRWHAYQNGQPLPLYQASPNAMIIYGQGNIELRYETPWFERVCTAVSSLTVLWLIIISMIQLKLYIIKNKT